MPLIHRLPSATVKLISSSQIITSVSSVVKELLENAIDAGARNIDIKIENNGQDGIEVRDNGSGVKKTDVISMCQPNCTSKIHEFNDLEQLESYGFRGEALNAICRVSDVCITTRTKDDDLGMVYVMDHNGNIVSSKPSALGTGTTVTVTRLFHNLPVRKQYLNSGKRAKDELKKTENIIKSLALINPSLRATFCHNKCLIWQKLSVAKLRDSLMQVIGHALVNKLEELWCTKDELNITLLVPKKNCEHLQDLCQSNIDCMMIYVNKRPVRYKKLEKVVLRCISETFDGQLTARKYPTCLVSVVTSPSDLDVNLEPNKTKVLLKDEEQVLQTIHHMLVTYYGIKPDIPKVIETNENSLNTTDSVLNDNSIGIQESEKEYEHVKEKTKAAVTTAQNKVFKKPETKGTYDLEGEAPCKRLKLHLADEATLGNITKSNDISEMNKNIDANAHVQSTSTSGDTSFSERIGHPLKNPVSHNLQKNLNEQSAENMGSSKNGDNSLGIPTLSVLGIPSSGQTPVRDSVIEKVKYFENLSITKEGDKSLQTTSLSSLGSLSSGRSAISDSVVERVVNRETSFQKANMLRDEDKSMRTLLSASEIMNHDMLPVRNSIPGNVTNRTINYQQLSVTQDTNTSVELTSLSALGSLNSGQSPISDNVVNKVVNRAAYFHKVSALSATGSPSKCMPSFSDSESVVHPAKELQNTSLSNNNQSMLDTTQCVGTLKQNEMLELPTLSDADIAKELDMDFHASNSANDETSLTNIVENEIHTRQAADAEVLNESFLSREVDIPGNKEMNSAIELGVDLNPKECYSYLGESASECWTRGQLKAPNGNLIQGASVLMSKPRSDVQVKTIDMSLQHISGQMEKKEHKAFVKFSKEERAKVLKENPGIIFTKISGILLERWQALSPEEQACYHETEKPKSSIVESPGQQDIRKLGNKALVQNETAKAKERWKIGNRKQQEMTVSLEKLRKPSDIILSQTEPPEVLVIGYVNPDGPWVYKRNGELGVMRHWGLKETMVYHRMMAEHTVPLQKLDKPILVDESAVGAENMQLLLSLKRNYDVQTNAVVVTSDIIKKNGFKLEVKEGAEQSYCLLTDVASTINFYGLDDLRETLDLLCKQGIRPLEKCRNLRVAGYIRGEAVRIIHQSPSMLDKQAVQELVNYWSANTRLLGNECLHRKPFFKKLHNISG